jgi:hypothetical protein
LDFGEGWGLVREEFRGYNENFLIVGDIYQNPESFNVAA